MKKKIKLIILFIVLLLVIAGIICLLMIRHQDKKEEVKDEGESSAGLIVDTPVLPEPEEKRMSLVMVGDALIHGAVYLDAKKGKTYDFSSMFTDIAPIIQQYDLRYYNQESIIGGGTPQHYPRLNSPDEIGKDLVNIGFNLVSLANNHSLDKGESGLVHSIAFWKTQNVATAGSYSSFEERDSIPIYEQNGIKYAFLAYTMRTNGLKAPKGKEYYVNVYDDALVKQHVEQAKAKGAEVIMVSMHWGDEYTHVPNSEQKKIAQYLSSLGVNIIIGAHPHVIQPMTYVGDTLVIYSLGNFISAQRVLGLEKIIGLLVGTDIVVKDDKVTFENTNFELLYTYYTSSNKNFKVIPFSKLNNSILKNYASTNTKYRKIVDPEGMFSGN